MSSSTETQTVNKQQAGCIKHVILRCWSLMSSSVNCAMPVGFALADLHFIILLILRHTHPFTQQCIELPVINQICLRPTKLNWIVTRGRIDQLETFKPTVNSLTARYLFTVFNPASFSATAVTSSSSAPQFSFWPKITLSSCDIVLQIWPSL